MCATPSQGLSHESAFSLHAWHLDFCDMQLDNKCKGTDHHCLHTFFFCLFLDNRSDVCGKKSKVKVFVFLLACKLGNPLWSIIFLNENIHHIRLNISWFHEGTQKKCYFIIIGRQNATHDKAGMAEGICNYWFSVQS